MHVHSEVTHACQDPDCHAQESAQPVGDKRLPLARVEHGRFYNYPVIGPLLRFGSWWLVFAGIYASSSVCVFCGTPGCPVGGGAAAVMGGIFGAIMAYGKSVVTHLCCWLYGLLRSNKA
jgi:hypothetical protein